ncbi:MAG: endonuclease/exonuclease/phosphatase family protein [Actinomycetaceae bacterium]|nr:endonuclease/exonuclease/phosphatase family protein [Actinomycetaceae bacterium]MDU0970912.1 endonuclease/exonuclease/phosphatase family protein [Actinomycetaceae bacterium]
MRQVVAASALVIAAFSGVLAGAALLAGRLGVARAVTTAPVLAQALAFPVVLLIVTAVAAVVAIIMLLTRADKGHRVTRARAAALAVVLMATVLSGALVFEGGARPNPTDAASTSYRMTVLEWNTEDRESPADFREFFRRYHPDVLVLPEMGDYRIGHTTRLSRLLRDAGENPRDYQIFTSTSGSEIAPVSIIVRRAFGDYRVEDEGLVTFGTLMLTPTADDSRLPDIIGLHTAPPLPGLMPAWRGDLSTIRTYLEGRRGDSLVVAGDFNAQRYHGDFSRLRGFHDSVPGAIGGTWPNSAPMPLRAHIDHILVSANNTVVTSAYVDTQASDHSAIVGVIAYGRRGD